MTECAADYGTPLNSSVCCGQPGNILDPNYICPQDTPYCHGYEALLNDSNHGVDRGGRWGTCQATPSEGRCAADYNTSVGGSACCNQGHTIDHIYDNCTADKPKCVGYISNTGGAGRYGTCTTNPPTGNTGTGNTGTGDQLDTIPLIDINKIALGNGNTSPPNNDDDDYDLGFSGEEIRNIGILLFVIIIVIIVIYFLTNNTKAGKKTKKAVKKVAKKVAETVGSLAGLEE